MQGSRRPTRRASRHQRAQSAVAFEVEWRYYFEIDAPPVIEAAGTDETSWFRARLLLPRGFFVEYTDGRQPLDLADQSTVFVGFRFGETVDGH